MVLKRLSKERFYTEDNEEKINLERKGWEVVGIDYPPNDRGKKRVAARWYLMPPKEKNEGS